jgi:hypothetical protein
MKQPDEWSSVNLDGDPLLVVGRRPKPRTLEGFVVDLHTETFDTMRGIARTTVDEFAGREAMDWHPNADMIPGEQYLSVAIEDLPAMPREQRPEPSAPESPTSELAVAADLIRLVLDPGALDNLHPAELAEERFRFYAIVWEAGDDGGPIAFVSEYDPTTVLRKASSYFRYDGTLRSADPPDFALDDRADLVVASDDVAVLSPTAFDRLFSDIRALLNDVPAYTQALRTAMVGLKMSDATEDAIRDVCARKPSYARQLQNLSNSPSAAAITPISLRGVLKRHGLKPNEFITRGVLDISPDQVGAILDVAEGRWYEADFTSEPRRASRWSRR